MPAKPAVCPPPVASRAAAGSGCGRYPPATVRSVPSATAVWLPAALIAVKSAYARQRPGVDRSARTVQVPSAVRVNGVGELTAVDVKPGGFDGDDAESLSDLGDMVVAAYRDAKAKADAMATEALGPLAGGLGGAPGQAPGQLGF